MAQKHVRKKWKIKKKKLKIKQTQNNNFEIITNEMR